MTIFQNCRKQDDSIWKKCEIISETFWNPTAQFLETAQFSYTSTKKNHSDYFYSDFELIIHSYLFQNILLNEKQASGNITSMTLIN